MKTNFYLTICLVYITLGLSAQTTVSFKPGAAIGEDAYLYMLDNNCIPNNQSTTVANINYGNSPTIKIMAWTWAAHGCRAGSVRSLLRFTELSTLPATATINSATLILRTARTGMDQGNSIYPGTPHSSRPNPGWLKRVNPGAADNWDEQTVTWNTAPSTDPNQANWVTIPVSNCHLDCSLNLDVTDIIKDIFDDMQNNVADANNGFLLQLQDEVYYRSQSWASSDYADSAYWPELIVNYTDCLDSLDLIAQPNPVCEGGDVQLSAREVPGADYLWIGPNGFSSNLDNPLLAGLGLDDGGDYILEVSGYGNNCVTLDTINIQVNPNPNVDLGQDTTICSGDVIELRPKQEYNTNTSYNWNTNETTLSINVTQPGLYWLTVMDKGCLGSDSVQVTIAPFFDIDLGSDTVLCNQESIVLKPESHFAQLSYLWSTGSRDSSLMVYGSGFYWLEAADQYGCIQSDSINVTYVQLAQNLGNDMLRCIEEPAISLNAYVPPGAIALWSTGESSAGIEVRDSGTYWVKVSYPPCLGTDTVIINTRKCECEVSMPNAFTPNGDELNDIFHPVMDFGCPVSEYSFKVFNRWGQLVYQSIKPGEGWDGTIAGKVADVGTYLYLLSYKIKFNNELKIVKGDVTLIR